MRIAVISDIHSNYIAFKATLADIEHARVDRIVCLGDAIYGGPQPVETIDRLRELDCPIVMGNADYFLLTGAIKQNVTVVQNAVKEWTLNKISKTGLDFISSFQETITLPMDPLLLYCFHGSPDSFNDIIFPETEEAQVQKWLAPFKTFILTGGHTHLQQIRRVGDSFFFNPGSVGLANGPRHEQEGSRLDPWAEYAIISVENKKTGLEFRRVPFDLNELIHVYRSSGRPFADEMISEYTR